MILMHKQCRGCWSRHDARWDPDVSLPLGLNMTTKVIDFMYLMHYYDAEISGHYWMLNTCLNSTKQACATNFIVYAVQKATPWFNTLGDGYLGLAPADGDGILTTQHNNVLEQMHFHGMIKKKMFGVHTHMFNSTEDPSEIRFGGYNEELFKAGHSQTWLNTVNTSTWELALIDGAFHEPNLYNDTSQRALIDPGYPFIAVPELAFEQF